jgi:uncharacterized protein YutE (UPF0331/DUF86 family)
MASDQPGKNLADIIKKAIDDLELTTSEYQEILAEAHADGQIDSEEQRLLKQLNDMIANGTIKRVPG